MAKENKKNNWLQSLLKARKSGKGKISDAGITPLHKERNYQINKANKALKDEKERAIYKAESGRNNPTVEMGKVDLKKAINKNKTRRQQIREITNRQSKKATKSMYDKNR